MIPPAAPWHISAAIQKQGGRKSDSGTAWGIRAIFRIKHTILRMNTLKSIIIQINYVACSTMAEAQKSRKNLSNPNPSAIPLSSGIFFNITTLKDDTVNNYKITSGMM